MILGLPVTITDEAQAGEEIRDWTEEAAGHIEGMDLSFLSEEILHAVKVSLSGITRFLAMKQFAHLDEGELLAALHIRLEKDTIKITHAALIEN